MNKLRLCFIIVGCALGLACQSTRTASESTAEIAKATGLAEIQRATSWEALKQGDRLIVGDQVRTGPDGVLEVRFAPHGGVMAIQPDSMVEFEQIGRSGTNQNYVAVVELSRGRVVGDTLKLPTGTKVLVKTRGADFAIP